MYMFKSLGTWLLSLSLYVCRINKLPLTKHSYHWCWTPRNPCFLFFYSGEELSPASKIYFHLWQVCSSIQACDVLSGPCRAIHTLLWLIQSLGLRAKIEHTHMRGKREINWNVAVSDRTVLEETKKRKTSDGVTCFCFLSKRVCGVETGRSCMYVCRVPVRWGIYFFNCLWSLPGFEVTLSEGGKKPRQKSPQVHTATRPLQKTAICIIYSLNSLNAKRWEDL